jgi:DNA-binding CsgD family transcriptional regulator
MFSLVAARARVLQGRSKVGTFDLGNPCPPVKTGTAPRRGMHAQQCSKDSSRRKHQTRRGRGGDTVSVVRDSDFYTLAALKNHPFYTEYLRDQMGTYSIMVPLPARPGRVRRLIFARDSGPDFSERDRLVLQLLRPHLHEVYLDAERRRRGIPHLSRREREVLQLVAQGFSNADIARALFISPATVAKHMEHIFDRTGVRTRSAAVALASPQVSAFAGLRPDIRRKEAVRI